MMVKLVRCTNCRFVGKVDIPKGSKVKYIRCPGCGKVTLR